MSNSSRGTVRRNNSLFLMAVGGLFGKLFKKGEGPSSSAKASAAKGGERGPFAPAVMNAYSQMASSFAGKGQPQNGVDTARQYFARIIGSFQVNKDALYELIGVAELARYGDPVIGEKEKDRALNALRLVQLSLEGAGEPAPVAAGPAANFPPPGFRPWVVAPVPLNPTPYATMPPDQVFRQVERSQADVDALSAAFRTSQLPPGAKLPDEMTDFIRDSIRTEDWLGLDGFVRKAIAGPAANWRVHVEHELCVYLVEMGCRMAQTRLLLAPPTRIAHELTLKAAGALAIAEGRDFVICDDIKLAVLALQVYNYKLNFGDANKALDIMPVPF